VKLIEISTGEIGSARRLPTAQFKSMVSSYSESYFYAANRLLGGIGYSRHKQ